MQCVIISWQRVANDAIHLLLFRIENVYPNASMQIRLYNFKSRQKERINTFFFEKSIILNLGKRSITFP